MSSATEQKAIQNGKIPLDNERMRIRFPEHDYDAYWLFGGIRGHGEFEALKLGFNIGAFDGYDWGVSNIPPDTNVCWYEIQLIGKDGKVSFVELPIERSEFVYDRNKLDIQWGDRFHVKGEWPNMYWYLSNPDKSIVVELNATMGIAHWSPDFIHKGTSWNTVAMIDFEYNGTITANGKQQPFSGIGTVDRPAGRLFKSPTSPGVGYWEYDAFMLEEKFGLMHWKMVDGNGKTFVKDGATNFPDGEYHSGEFKMEYTKFEDRGTVRMAREWKCELKCDHGTLEYTVQGLGQEANGIPHTPGTGLPNLFMMVDGTFTSKSGEKTSFTGKGTGELILCEWDPSTNSKHKPW
jgi:hypothetical protein